MTTSADHFDYMDDWQDGGIALDPDREDPWITDDQHGETRA